MEEHATAPRPSDGIVTLDSILAPSASNSNTMLILSPDATNHFKFTAGPTTWTSARFWTPDTTTAGGHH